MIQTHHLHKVGVEEGLKRGELRWDPVANQKTLAPHPHTLQMKRVPPM